jgi:hypothetical protein
MPQDQQLERQLLEAFLGRAVHVRACAGVPLTGTLRAYSDDALRLEIGERPFLIYRSASFSIQEAAAGKVRAL